MGLPFGINLSDFFELVDLYTVTSPDGKVVENLPFKVAKELRDEHGFIVIRKLKNGLKIKAEDEIYIIPVPFVPRSLAELTNMRDDLGLPTTKET